MLKYSTSFSKVVAILSKPSLRLHPFNNKQLI